jgi:hypothetical protein
MFVDQVEQPYAATIMRLSADEVIAPHMVAMCRPEPHARAILVLKDFASGNF